MYILSTPSLNCLEFNTTKNTSEKFPGGWKDCSLPSTPWRLTTVPKSRSRGSRDHTDICAGTHILTYVNDYKLLHFIPCIQTPTTPKALTCASLGSGRLSKVLTTVQADLKLLLFLFQHPTCWRYSHRPPD